MRELCDCSYLSTTLRRACYRFATTRGQVQPVHGRHGLRDPRVPSLGWARLRSTIETPGPSRVRSAFGCSTRSASAAWPASGRTRHHRDLLQRGLLAEPRIARRINADGVAADRPSAARHGLLGSRRKVHDPSAGDASQPPPLAARDPALQGVIAAALEPQDTPRGPRVRGLPLRGEGDAGVRGAAFEPPMPLTEAEALDEEELASGPEDLPFRAAVSPAQLRSESEAAPGHVTDEIAAAARAPVRIAQRDRGPMLDDLRSGGGRPQGCERVGRRRTQESSLVHDRAPAIVSDDLRTTAARNELSANSRRLASAGRQVRGLD